jgi:hypothetical protein
MKKVVERIPNIQTIIIIDLDTLVFMKGKARIINGLSKSNESYEKIATPPYVPFVIPNINVKD